MHATKATALGMTFAAIPLLLAAFSGFSDVSGTKHAASILLLAERGVVQGYADGTFRPDNTINRAEFLKILLEARYPDAATPSDLRCFSDMMARVPQWYARPVCLGRELGIVNGYPDGTFRPGNTVNLAEALKIALLAFDVRVGDAAVGQPWYEPYVLAARQRGMALDLLTKPEHLVTRGEMASIASALLLADEERPSSATGDAAVCGNNVVEQGEQCDDGNLENGDGCSQLCILVPEPVRLAILQVDAEAVGTVTNVARGKTGVPLLRFRATTGRQDALLTGVTFLPSVGSLAYAQNYVLAMDRDGDGRYETVLQSAGKAQGNRLTFDALSDGGVTLYEGIPARFEVRADITSALGPISIGLQFATPDPEYIRATGANRRHPAAGHRNRRRMPQHRQCLFYPREHQGQYGYYGAAAR